MATKVTKSTKKTASKKAAKKVSNNERGYGTFAVPKITPKNMKTADVKELNLRDFVLGALAANPDMTNEELCALVHKAGRENSTATIGWYAARVRQGHIKTKKG
ncbi:MAG TPA: hypothetical protein VEA37_02650 [Flavobacterium sp.]|nr:hypothetical protein [Flavobacterium sp.]